MERFKEVLKSRNLKSTHQRLAILKCIESSGHIDIDSLYESIIQHYPTMSKATLYRNINDLIDCDVLEEIKLPYHKQQYEIKKAPHVHLLCTECKLVQDMTVDTAPLFDSISSQSGFQIYSSQLIVNGLCKTCQS